MRSVPRTNRSLLRRTLRWGLVVSVALHAGLLLVMAIGSVRTWLDQRPIQFVQASPAYARPREAEDPVTATVMITQEDPAPVGIRERLAETVAAAQERSADDQLDALDEASARLGRISSESSVNDVAERLGSWFGLNPRAERPADPDEVAEESADLFASQPPFDFDTAQLHDVTRQQANDGHWQYTCILLDAAGQTMEVPLSEAEGAPIFTLMEKIKGSPLLEQIYRQIAMPMLDQLIQAERAAAAAADSAAESPDRQVPESGEASRQEAELPSARGASDERAAAELP